MSATKIEGRQIKNLGGDASGTGDALVVTGLQGVPVSATAPTLNYVLTFNGTDWVPAPGGGGGGGSPAGSTGNVQFNSAGSFGADSTFNWDATNGALVVGGFPAPLPGPLPSVVAIADGGPAAFVSAMYSSGGDGPLFIGLRAGGSQASPSATPSGKHMLSIAAIGYASGSFDFSNSGGEIKISSNELWTSGAHGTDLDVQLCPSGSITPAGVLYATGNGGGRLGVGLGPGTPPDTTLHIGGSLKIVDGTQSSGYLLTSDSSGVGSWQPPPSGTLPTPTILGDSLIVSESFGKSVSGTSPATSTGGGNFNIEINGADYAQMPIVVNNFEGSGAYFQFMADDGTNIWAVDANNIEGVIQISNTGTYLGGFSNPTGSNGILVPDGAGNVWLAAFNTAQIAKIGPGGSFAYTAVDSATGMTFDGTYMWVAGNNSTLTAYDLTGAQIMTFDISSYFGSFSGYPTAIAFDGTDLWVSGITGAIDTTVYVKFDLTGTFLNSYSTTAFGYSSFYYLVYALGSLWSQNPTGSGGLLNVSLSGVFTGFPGGPISAGPTFDGSRFFYTDGQNVYRTDGAGNTSGQFNYGHVASFPNITGIIGFSGGIKGIFFDQNNGDFSTVVRNAPLSIGSAPDGPTIASEIQSAVTPLVANTFVTGNPQQAYTGFTATYNGTNYVLTSGFGGTGSAVVMTSALSGDVAAPLLLGVANGGTETIGAFIWSQGTAVVSQVGGVSISTSGQSSGYLLVSNGSGGTSWQSPGSIATAANGPDGSVQFAQGGLLESSETHFFWDNSNFRLGIGTASPQYDLDVNGNINYTGQLLLEGNPPSSTQLLSDGFDLVNSSTNANGDISGSFGSSFFVTALNGVAIVGSNPSDPGMVLVTTVANPNQVSWTHLSSFPSWQKFTVAYTDLSASGVFTNSFSFTTLPAGAIVHGVKLKHSTSFTGGAVTGYKVSVGDGTTADAYASAFDVFQGTASSLYQLTNLFIGVDQSTGPNIHMTATSTGDTLDHAAHGSVDVWVLVSVAV